MSRLTRDGVAEPVSRDQILRRERGQGNINFLFSADHKQDWQPYPVDPSLSAGASVIYLIRQPPSRVSPEPIGSRKRVPMAFTSGSPPAHSTSSPQGSSSNGCFLSSITMDNLNVLLFPPTPLSATVYLCSNSIIRGIYSTKKNREPCNVGEKPTIVLYCSVP